MRYKRYLLKGVIVRVLRALLSGVIARVTSVILLQIFLVILFYYNLVHLYKIQTPNVRISGELSSKLVFLKNFNKFFLETNKLIKI